MMSKVWRWCREVHAESITQLILLTCLLWGNNRCDTDVTQNILLTRDLSICDTKDSSHAWLVSCAPPQARTSAFRHYAAQVSWHTRFIIAMKLKIKLIRHTKVSVSCQCSTAVIVIPKDAGNRSTSYVCPRCGDDDAEVWPGAVTILRGRRVYEFHRCEYCFRIYSGWLKI